MNLRDEILRDRSKAQIQRIAEWIGNNKARYQELTMLFLSGDPKVTPRAGWVLSHCADTHPHLILPYLSDFLEYAQNPPHGSVQRNVIRAMTLIVIPEELEGLSYDLCYALAAQVKEDIAVRVHAMSVITAIALKYPELKSEVYDLLQSLKDHESAGIRSRSRKLLKKLT